MVDLCNLGRQGVGILNEATSLVSVHTSVYRRGKGITYDEILSTSTLL